MRALVEILDAEGKVVASHEAREPLTFVGGGDDDQIRVAGLPTHAITLEFRGGALFVAAVGSYTEVVDPTVFRIRPDLAIRVIVLPVEDAAGGCPRCSSPLVDRAVGGAYRSIARRERSCARCGTTVLELEDAERSIGAFVDLSRTDWVAVIVPIRCPRCRQTMRRSVFRTRHGEAEVERCASCHVAVLDPTDRLRLTGE